MDSEMILLLETWSPSHNIMRGLFKDPENYWCEGDGSDEDAWPEHPPNPGIVFDAAVDLQPPVRVAAELGEQVPRPAETGHRHHGGVGT